MTAKRKIMLSLLLALSAGCVVMCVRSYWRADSAYAPGCTLVSEWGGLRLVRSNWPRSFQWNLYFDHNATRMGSLGFWSFWGFSFGHFAIRSIFADQDSLGETWFG